jgi:glycosyltransferase involved in cell wall biosynthesis
MRDVASRNDASSGRPTVVLVDWNVTKASPIGSGVLELIDGLHERFRFVVLAAYFEASHPDTVEHIRVRVPPGPAFVKELSWPALVRLASWRRGFRLRPGRAFAVRATQGQLPGADISDSHFCHRAYLEKHFANSGTIGLRRISRYLVHRASARLERRAFQRASVITVPSLGLQREIVAYYPFARDKLVHIPNPLDTEWYAPGDDFDRASARQRLGYGTDDVVFVFVGLGDFARKGLKIAIGALQLMKAPNGRVLVVGGTKSEVALFERIAVAAGVDDRLQFVGFQSDIRPYLWLADVFLFPTLYEAAPKVIDQAAAAGLPAIATRVHGIEGRIEHGLTGWFADRTAEAFAGAMERAVHSRGSLSEMGERAQGAAQSLDRRFYVERWKEVLERVLLGTQSPSPEPTVDSKALAENG